MDDEPAETSRSEAVDASTDGGGRSGPFGLPQITLPHVELPRITLPHVELPHVELPHLTWPDLSEVRIPNPFDALDQIAPVLQRDEADLVLVAGNVALVAFGIIEWPVAALTLAVHALARTRLKGLQAAAEVAEEAEG